MPMHYDSLVAVKDCVLNLPFCGRFFYKLIYKERRYPPNKKNVSLAGLFPCLNDTNRPSRLAGLEGVFMHIRYAVKNDQPLLGSGQA